MQVFYPNSFRNVHFAIKMLALGIGRRRSGVWQTPATAKKKKPDGIPRNGRKEQNQRIPLPASSCEIFCYLSQSSQHFDAINRPVRHFLDAGAHTWDIQQQESTCHESRHPDDLPEDLLECYGHDGSQTGFA